MAQVWWRRIPTSVRWIIGIVVVLILIIVTADLINWNAARGLVARIASRHLGRRVEIGGPLRVHLLSSTPGVSIDQLTIANPDWATGGDFLDVAHIDFTLQLSQLLRGHLVFRTLDIEQPKLDLRRDASQRANWDFTPPGTPPNPQPTKLPAIRHFVLHGGTVDVDDAIQKLTFHGTVAAHQSGSLHEHEPFGLDGQGTLNKEPFKMSLQGGPLLDVDPEVPYRFQLKLDAGPSMATIDGSITKPFDFGQFDAKLEVQGQNLANLYYLTGVPLPLTAPYHVALGVHRAGMHFTVDNLVGKIGNSDVAGHGALDFNREGRPSLKIAVTSKSLNLRDLGIAVGADVPQQSDTTGAPQAPAPEKGSTSAMLLPTYKFQFDRLVKLDADLDFHADSVQTQSVPIKAVGFKLTLDHGLLQVNPLDFDLPLGKLTGNIQLDTRSKSPQTAIDFRLTDVKLDQFKGKNATESPLSGELKSHIHLEGHGNSVHDIAADSNGTLAAVIPSGEVRQSFAELTGINIINGLGLLLSGNKKTAEIRCGVAEFEVKDGDARVARLIIDTEPVLITGKGHLTFSDEALDIDISGKPKKLRLTRIRAPINVRGTLLHPTVGIAVQDVVKQGAIAAAAGALLTPVGALIAFIDPGLAKDQNCAALLNDAGGH
ncbi:MAG TPA: AsmA family protein [Steroidobacteraceae bacterium]|jgi:hypothetical protein